METLQDAKDYLNENYEKGVKCPCCKQTVKLYKRKLNSGMARTLIAMFNGPEGYIHVKNYLRENNLRNTHDFTLLKFWKLISPPLENSSGQEVGLWKITDKGKQFCRGEIKVQKHVLILTNNHIGFSNEETSIKESLGDAFDYNELMRGL